jgi:hypothetical protein
MVYPERPYFEEYIQAVNAKMDTDWLSMCRDKGIDPEEVRLVFDRYEAYRGFTRDKRGALISLDQWFSFYHMEKASEGDKAAPAPSGCSVDSDAVNNACIKRPGPFLEVLKAYRVGEEIG